MRKKGIKSPSNPTYLFFLKLLKARGIKKEEKAIFSGPKQVKELLRDFPHTVEGLIMTEDMTPPQESSLFSGLSYILPEPLFRKCDIFGTASPLLITKVPAFSSWRAEDFLKGCTLLIPFQDPSNVGTVIRSAAALGADRVVMLKESAHPFHPRSMRAGGSSLFRIPILEGPSIYKIKKTAVPMVLLSAKGKDLARFQFPPSFCLIPGIEGPGIPEDMAGEFKVGITMERGVESINAAHATAVFLYAWNRELKKCLQNECAKK